MMPAISPGIWSTITDHHLPSQGPVGSVELPEGSSAPRGQIARPSIDVPSPQVCSNRVADLISGYAQIVTDRVREGWSCYLVTFMFDRLHGSRLSFVQQMKERLQKFYSTLVTRVNRKPRTASPDDLPVLIGLADLPVHKRDKISAPSAFCNDGFHFHALVLLPPSSRIKVSLVDHLNENQRLYAGAGMPIRRIHAEPVTGNHERVVDYIFKTVTRRRLSYDEAVLVYPRSRSELL